MPKTKKENPTVSKEQEAHHRSTSIGGDVKDSVVIAGDGNQTIFQKVVNNIFRGESESTEHRNRRVMLNHMENFWIKGVLEKSLHGVALLELGIKEDPTAVNYPWGIKKASTNETLPAGKSMLEIFKEVGLGRSLLVLGAPGSGKTTMLLELTRQLIETARQDDTEPIPVIFNLSSWTEKLSIANWLADQLNIFYYVPKKTAQKLVTENKMFLLLDGLDEVKENLREKCVDVINEFKKEYGLTSLAICSRIEEYQSIQTKLSLAGAITLQSLTSEQVDSYFDKFGKSLSSLKEILKKDKTLGELTETPLMLSIMVLAYKDVNIKEIPALKNSKEQRRHLFDTYINRMFERSTRTEKKDFSKVETFHYLSWLANQMVKHNLITYQIEGMQPSWLENKQKRFHRWLYGLFFGLSGGLIVGLYGLIFGLSGGLMAGLIGGLVVGLYGLIFGLSNRIQMVDKLSWSWQRFHRNGLFFGLMGGLIFGSFGLILGLSGGLIFGLFAGLIFGLFGGLIFGLSGGLILELSGVQIEETNYPGQRIKQTLYSSITKGLIVALLFFEVFFGLMVKLDGGRFGLILVLRGMLFYALFFGLIFGLFGGLDSLIKHYLLRNILIKNGFLPQQLIPFLEYAVELIFLRRVGGSYIFVHRLLMEHFAEMYVEKENK